MEVNCTCKEWARKVGPCTIFGEVAVTFHCPAHGSVTIDARRVPRPLAIAPGSRPSRTPPLRGVGPRPSLLRG